MINKVKNNTLCRSVFIFSTNALQKLKQFAFHFKYFFQRFSEERTKKDVWGAPCRQDEHQVLHFCAKMPNFFPREVRCQYFGWNRHLMSSVQELTSKSSPWAGKIQDESYPWPVRFCFFVMSSSRKPGPPDTDFVCDKSYPLKVSKLGILNPS